MKLLPNLDQRDLQGEVMDDPELDEYEHVAALRGLARINRISRSAALMWNPIQAIARDSANMPLRILDIATGSGDLPVQLQQRAARANISLDFTAVDISERALDVARDHAEQASVSVTFETLDILTDELPADFDIVMCSLFLHHLNTDDVSRLLERMANAARRCVLVNDLRRSCTSYWLAHAACRLLTRSRVVHIDGPLSVQAAFTIDEMQQLAADVGMETATVTSHWPARLLLKWIK